MRARGKGRGSHGLADWRFQNSANSCKRLLAKDLVTAFCHLGGVRVYMELGPEGRLGRRGRPRFAGPKKSLVWRFEQ